MTTDRMTTDRSMDCIVCGETCLDIVARPIPLDRPLAEHDLVKIDSPAAVTGGIVPNSGIVLARLGLRVAGMGLVGDDDWGRIILGRLRAAGIDTRHVTQLTTVGSSVTVVLTGRDGEHTFAFYPGASQRIDKAYCLDRLDEFAQARYALFGYYHLLPNLESDLPEVLAAVRGTGCRTALDTTNGGGTLQPLDRILPHLDLYVPSYSEARGQTGCDDPVEMIRTYRQYGGHTLLGIKLGERGAVLSPSGDDCVWIDPVSPPGPVVDTTGAGDAFYAGLIAGLLNGLDTAAAGRLGAAAGACCVTGLGGAAGVRDLAQVRSLAGRG